MLHFLGFYCAAGLGADSRFPVGSGTASMLYPTDSVGLL